MRYQLVGQKIELAGGNFNLRRMRHDAIMNPPHKARVAQAQHRHQPHQVAHQLVNVGQLQRLPFAVDKAAQGHHAAVIRQLALQAIKNALIIVLAGHPAVAQRAKTPHPIAAGLVFAKGQDDMQMMLAPLNIAGRKPEILALKRVQLRLRRQQQRQRIKQAGFPPGVLADQDIILLQHQR